MVGIETNESFSTAFDEEQGTVTDNKVNFGSEDDDIVLDLPVIIGNIPN